MLEHHRRNGRYLTARRRALGFTQEQLATLAGVTQKAISHYELGIREPRDAIKLMIAASLGCGVGDIWPHADRTEIAALVRDVQRGDAA